MKIKNFMMIALAGAFAITACNKKDESWKKSYEDYRTYVKSSNDSIGFYYDQDSAMAEQAYNDRMNAVETNMANMDEESKKEYAQLKVDYDALRTKYQDERSEKMRASAMNSGDARKVRLFGMLLPQGTEMNLSSVTPENLLPTYISFVEAVDQNRETLSAEDWDEVEKIWDALDNRKQEVEKQAPSGANNKIASEKLKYGGLKTRFRAQAKREAKSESKDNAEQNAENN